MSEHRRLFLEMTPTSPTDISVEIKGPFIDLVSTCRRVTYGSTTFEIPEGVEMVYPQADGPYYLQDGRLVPCPEVQAE